MCFYCFVTHIKKRAILTLAIVEVAQWNIFQHFKKIVNNFKIVGLNACFNVWPSDFRSLYMTRHVMGALIMTSIEYAYGNKFIDSRGNQTLTFSGLSRLL